MGEKLAAYAKQHQGKWIIGRGWDQTLWPGGQFPNAADLDRYVADKPVMLSRVDGHAIWVNSKAMELAKLDPAVTAPEAAKLFVLAITNLAVFLSIRPRH